MGSEYRLRDFDFQYPPELVAQYPLPDRAASRLLIVDRSTGSIRHETFTHVPELLAPGDVLVRNVSRVIRARLHGVRENGATAEVLLAHPEADGTWLALVHPGGKLKVGRRIRFGNDAEVEIVEVLRGGLRRLRWSGTMSPEDIMGKYGEVPLPPYIHRAPEPADRERYQTVFAKEDGSIAAPTAGLHFTREILAALERRGVLITDVSLHVGPGTFKPVESEDVTKHHMLAEQYTMPPETADAIDRARATSRTVWAVGTTTVRVLETVGATGQLHPGTGWTELFIYPPYEFKVVGALLTNFHRPQSTLFMLVAAFAGLELIRAAYAEAIEQRYRLFSYGDAMAIV